MVFRAHWVRKLRASLGQADLRHGRREEVVFEEVRGPRSPRRYLEVAPGARPHVAVDRRPPMADFESVAAAVPVCGVVHPRRERLRPRRPTGRGSDGSPATAPPVAVRIALTESLTAVVGTPCWTAPFASGSERCGSVARTVGPPAALGDALREFSTALHNLPTTHAGRVATALGPGGARRCEHGAWATPWSEACRDRGRRGRRRGTPTRSERGRSCVGCPRVHQA